MNAAIERIERCRGFVSSPAARRVRVIVVDGSPQYLKVVCDLLDLQEIVDVIGRAANFDEAIQLVVNLQPDVVLMDIAMPYANLVVAAIILSEGVSPVKVVVMCDANSIELEAPSAILAFSALIHKARLRQELCTVLDALDGWPRATSSLGAQIGFPHRHQREPARDLFPPNRKRNFNG